MLGWILDRLDDVASDFSAIHGVRDVSALPPGVFFAMAPRLPAYQGVLRARALAADDDQAPGGARPGVTEIPATRAALSSAPEFAAMFSFG